MRALFQPGGSLCSTFDQIMSNVTALQRIPDAVRPVPRAGLRGLLMHRLPELLLAARPAAPPPRPLAPPRPRPRRRTRIPLRRRLHRRRRPGQ